ncbi:MAG TPA: hypothetical protein VF791_20185 [Pyrinomonadaceae bacterium]
MDIWEIRFKQFGDLKALDRGDSSRRMYWWLCQYRCGNYRRVEEKRLVAGLITSCIHCQVRK